LALFVVLAQHRARLGLERGFAVFQVLEAVGLDLQHGLQVLPGEGGVVIGEVVAGVGVLARAGLGDDVLVLLRRVGAGAAEHHVLEEVGEARLARLDLVARTGLYRDRQRHQVREAGRHDDDLQAVGQQLLGGLEGQHVRPGGRSGCGCGGRSGRGRDGGNGNNRHGQRQAGQRHDSGHTISLGKYHAKA